MKALQLVKLGPPIRKSAEPAPEEWIAHPTNKNLEVSSTTGKWRTKNAPIEPFIPIVPVHDYLTDSLSYLNYIDDLQMCRR